MSALYQKRTLLRAFLHVSPVPAPGWQSLRSVSAHFDCDQRTCSRWHAQYACQISESDCVWAGLVVTTYELVRLANFFCKMMTIMGNPDAANALTTNSLLKFCVVIAWLGSNKEDRKNARVVIRYIIAVWSEEKPARCSSSG